MDGILCRWLSESILTRNLLPNLIQFYFRWNNTKNFKFSFEPCNAFFFHLAKINVIILRQST